MNDIASKLLDGLNVLLSGFPFFLSVLMSPTSGPANKGLAVAFIVVIGVIVQQAVSYVTISKSIIVFLSRLLQVIVLFVGLLLLMSTIGGG